MDPVTTAIIAGATAGAAAGATELAKTAIMDAYNGLKALIRKKFGETSDLTSAIAALESKPDSAARQAMVKEEVAASGATKDDAIVSAAKQMLANINATPTGQNIMQAIGSNIAQADRGGTATVNVNQPSEDQ